ncbi:MAG: glycosyltransferase [Lachnospiraceae bacterium]|nr:glycosyltransferase [Lachnospiraceae bacterium]
MLSNHLEEYSVLMSVYKNDNPSNLKIAIKSMLNQTIPPEQFVIVEDGYVSDDLEKIIREYEKDSETFTIVRLEKNMGLGNALNNGLKVCRNELVARMDADDISVSQRCEKQLKRFSEKEELCILGTQIKEFIDVPEHTISRRTVPCSFDGIKKFARRRSPFNHPTVMYKRNVILKIGGYPVLNRKEDLGLFVLAVNLGIYSENLDEDLLYYRTNKYNQKRRRTWINCKEYIQVMMRFYRRGYIGVLDMCFIVLGQMSLFVLPTAITNYLSKRYLRKV